MNAAMTPNRPNADGTKGKRQSIAAPETGERRLRRRWRLWRHWWRCIVDTTAAGASWCCCWRRRESGFWYSLQEKDDAGRCFGGTGCRDGGIADGGFPGQERSGP